MTVTEIHTPYVDTRAADLRFSLNHARLEPLVEQQFGEVTVAILGASHQVIVGDFIETVAYLPEEPTRLPTTVLRTGYELATSTSKLSPDELHSTVEELEFRMHDQSLFARFPGHPDAVTAITVDVAHGPRLAWRTWHCYPTTGEIVCTKSVFTSTNGADARC